MLKMRTIPTNKILMREYRLTQDELFDIMNKCLNYYLSKEELYKFIEEYYFKLEMRLNKKHQRKSKTVLQRGL